MTVFCLQVCSAVNRTLYSKKEDGTEAIACLNPKSTKLGENNNDVHSLPPFPLVVKSCSTSVKEMGLVVDYESLKHFRNSIDQNVVVEEYVPHDNTINKVCNSSTLF